jgi:hypothetical protein
MVPHNRAASLLLEPERLFSIPPQDGGSAGAPAALSATTSVWDARDVAGPQEKGAGEL